MSQTIAGGLFNKYVFHGSGKKPEIPDLPNIDIGQIQQDTITGNQKNLAGAQALSNAINQGNAAQLRAILNRGGGLDLAESITNSQLRGELDQYSQKALRDSVASSALGLGLPGTQFQTGIAGLRGVLSSLQLQQQGLQNFQSLARLTTPQLVGPESMFFTPQQRLNFAFQDRAAHFERNLMAAQVAAAPNPADVALAEGFDNFFKFWSSVGGAALGNIGGGIGSTGVGGGPKMNPQTGMGIG